MGMPGNATRMELLRLKRRLTLARRGHHLLKGKRDELLRQFLIRLEDYFRRREQLHVSITELAEKTGEVRTEVSVASIRTAVWPPPAAATLQEGKSSILNLRVPSWKLNLATMKRLYGPTQIPIAYDELAMLWRRSAPLLVDVGEKEAALLLIAEEIEKTRRRVNALEYKLIPDLESGIKEITFKLAEAERGNLTRLMRIKDIVQSR